MTAPQTSSRLQLLQARFQQKQLQEKEQKLLQLYDQQQQRAHQVAQRGSAGSSASNGSGAALAHPAAKWQVDRQPSERRLQSAVKGIDKSYPLEPLNGRPVPRRTHAPGMPEVTRSLQTLGTTTGRGLATRGRRTSRDTRGLRDDLGGQRPEATGDFDGTKQHYEINIDDVIDNEAMQRNRLLAKFQTSAGEGLDAVDARKSKRRTATEQPAQVGALPAVANPRNSNGKTLDSVARRSLGHLSISKSLDADDVSEEKNIIAKVSNAKHANQAERIVTESPNSKEVKKSFSGTTSFDEEKPKAFVSAIQRSESVSSGSSVTSDNRGTGARTPSAPGSISVTKAKVNGSTLASRTAAKNELDSLSKCKVCNRNFAVDRISLHEQICQKAARKKRKQFDVANQRVKGTELESFAPKMIGGKSVPARSTRKVLEPTKSNWRRKHEELINAIRSAKLMQTHLASGGKLSDLPPPPPSDTSDYVQCPHCSRKFNAAVAERHIPKCAQMQHNKPPAKAGSKLKR